MAITLHTPGTWAYAASGSVTVTLPTHSTGDMLLVRIAYKSGAIATCTASCATAGWNKVSTEFHDGTTNSGNGLGSVGVAVFWKEAASASETNPTIDFSQTVTQVGRVGMAYSKTDTYWETPIGSGGAAAGGTNITASASINAPAAGDMFDFFTGVRDDCTMTVPSISHVSATFGAITESPAAAGTDTSGADGAYDGGYAEVTGGGITGDWTITNTLSTSETAAAWATRLRSTNTAPFSPMDPMGTMGFFGA